MPVAPRDHRAHQALVTRHVDDAEVRALAEIERCEAELDRDAAALLLGQPIGVDAGQRLDQRRLPVVDVPGGPEHQRRGFGVRAAHAFRGADALPTHVRLQRLRDEHAAVRLLMVLEQGDDRARVRDGGAVQHVHELVLLRALAAEAGLQAP